MKKIEKTEKKDKEVNNQPRQSVVVATANPGKLRELKKLLPKSFELSSLVDYSQSQVREDGHSFVENALIKARHASRLAKLPAIADDSGICVTALNNAPGLYSARYSQMEFNHATHFVFDTRYSVDDNNNQKLLLALAAEKQRHAFFHCALVYVEHEFDAMPLIATANWYGSIVRREPKGRRGFGYDPLFLVGDYTKDGLPCTAAQLTDVEKLNLSHRGQASKKLAKLLAEQYPNLMQN